MMMRLGLLGFSIGVISLLAWQPLPAELWVMGFIGSGFTFLLIQIFTPEKYFFRKILLFLGGACLGLGWALFFALGQLQQILPIALENKNLVVIGKIVSIPETLGDSQRFEFQILQTQHANYHNKVRLTWQKAPALQAGETWQLPVRIKRPHSSLNPGEFDQEAWLFAHRIHATGYVNTFSNSDPPRKLIPASFSLNLLRQQLTQHIVAQLADNPMTGFITALSVGVRTRINDDQWQVLRNTGTNHLMAIAGLHIGFVAASAFFFITLLWRLFPGWMLRIPAPQAGAAAALCVAILYSALAGFSLPTERACLMLGVFLCAQLGRRHLPPWHALLLALSLILWLDPLAPLTQSFWLSFVTVALLIYAFQKQTKAARWWHWLKMQWVITIGLIPLTLWFFQQFALAGLLANLIAIPWVGFLVLPCTLLGCLFLFFSPAIGGALLHLAATLLTLIWQMLTKISALSSWQWQHGISQLWIIVIAMAGILLLFSPVKMYKRWFGFLGFLPLFFYHPASPALGEIYLTVLDVGQGLSVVIQTKQHTLVYDTGAKLSDNFDLGESVVAPYLRTQTISHLDTVILSHGDNDHIGGAAAVLSAFPTTTVLTAVPPELLPLWQLPAHLHLQKCIAGQKWQWDGVDFTIFNSACVLKITTGKNSILLTGDIEKADEKFLLQNAAPLHSTILLAPHHGSANSSTPDFVAAVAPQFVLFSTGYLNRFHFPNAAVVARYQQIGAQIYNTAFTGAIIFKIKPHASMQAPQLYRLSQGHFWNFPYK